MLSLFTPLIIPGSLDNSFIIYNHDKEEKSFSVLRKLGKHPNLEQILVTLIPAQWPFFAEMLSKNWLVEGRKN